MKNLKILFLLFAIVFMFSFSSGDWKNDLEKENLKGKVKSIKSSSFLLPSLRKEYKDSLLLSVVKNYDTNGNKIETIVFSSNGSIKEREVFKFENNRKIEWIIYDSVNLLRIKWNYNYFEDGRLREKFSIKRDGNLGEKYILIYDSLKRLIEEKVYNNDNKLLSRTIYKYDFQHNSKEMISFNSDGSLESKHVYNFDNKGNKIEDDWFFSNGNLFKKEILEYDNKSKLISSVLMDSNNKIQHKSRYWYDLYGKLIKIRRSYSFGKKSISTNKFQYHNIDQKGNWLLKMDIENNIQYTSGIREIEYYD